MPGAGRNTESDFDIVNVDAHQSIINVGYSVSLRSLGVELILESDAPDFQVTVHAN